MPINLKELARVGAQARLVELLAEVAEIQRAFPGIGGARRSGPAQASTAKKTVKRRRRKPMSAAEKKAVSERMKRYWASRRKEKG